MQSPGAVALLVYLSGSATNAPITGLFSAFNATSTSSVNVLPVAAFTSSANDLVASFDASTSKDPDGSITTYAWKFGDSATGSGVSAVHTYAAGGTYTVTLTVTDNSGGTNAVSHPITVAPAVSSGLPTYASIVNAAKLAANYYRTTYAHTTLTPKNGWSWSTYTQGVQTLFQQAGDQAYLNDNLAWGSSNSWAVAQWRDQPRHGQGTSDLLRRERARFDGVPYQGGRRDGERSHEAAGLAIRLGRRAVHGTAGLDAMGNANGQHGLPRQDGFAVRVVA